MNKKKLLIYTLAALLLLSVLAFAVVALAEEGGDTVSPAADPMDSAQKKKPTATPGRGLWTASPTPKPTPEPTEFPFFPGLLEDHKGHTVTKKVTPADETTHTVRNYCEDCEMYFGGETAEPHNWVHDSYKKDENLGSEEGHIEVFKCTVCEAQKQEKQFHNAGIRVAFRQEGDAQTHIEVRQCTACRQQFEVDRPHEFEHDSYRNDGDTGTHIEALVCTDCGQKADGNRAAHKPVHIGWESVSETQDREIVRCNMCELTYTLAPAAHTFDGGIYETFGVPSVAKLFHIKYTVCTKCGAYQNGGEGKQQKHDYGSADSIACILCNQVRDNEQHEHIVNKGKFTVIPLNAEMHFFSYCCKDNRCAARFPDDYTPHTFDPVTMKCGVCGYLKDGCAHSYSYQPAKSGSTAEKHTLIGTCTGCGKEIRATGEHNMEFAYASAYIPCKNGHTCTVTYRCSVCGYETQKEETEVHDFSSFEPISEKEHRGKCSKCGEYDSPEKHRYVCTADGTAHVCSECGKQGEHDYFLAEMKMKDESDGGHYRVYQCRVCAHQKEEFEQHTVVNTYKPWDAAKHNWIFYCTECIYSHDWLDFHHFDENGVCSQCGYKKAE